MTPLLKLLRHPTVSKRNGILGRCFRNEMKRDGEREEPPYSRTGSGTPGSDGRAASTAGHADQPPRARYKSRGGRASTDPRTARSAKRRRTRKTARPRRTRTASAANGGTTDPRRNHPTARPDSGPNAAPPKPPERNRHSETDKPRHTPTKRTRDRREPPTPPPQGAAETGAGSAGQGREGTPNPPPQRQRRSGRHQRAKAPRRDAGKTRAQRARPAGMPSQGRREARRHGGGDGPRNLQRSAFAPGARRMDALRFPWLLDVGVWTAIARFRWPRTLLHRTPLH